MSGSPIFVEENDEVSGKTSWRISGIHVGRNADNKFNICCLFSQDIYEMIIDEMNLKEVALTIPFLKPNFEKNMNILGQF